MTKQKTQMLSLAIFAGLLAGVVGTMTATTAMAQDFEAHPFGLEAESECFGYFSSVLFSEDQDMFGVIDAEYEKVYQEYGFVFEAPELTEKQQEELDEKLCKIEMKYNKEIEQIFASTFFFAVPSDEDLENVDSVIEKIEEESKSVFEEFGFVIVEPQLSEQQQKEMGKKLAQLDKKYESMMFVEGVLVDSFESELNTKLSPEKQKEFEQQLTELNMQYEQQLQELFEEYGIVPEVGVFYGP